MIEDYTPFVMEGSKLIKLKDKSTKAVVIPQGVTEIGTCAFDTCRSLESVTIPDSVTRIGHGAFSDCSALRSVHIPDSVTIIENYAFKVCTSLESVTIPDSVTKIGLSVFHGCDRLEYTDHFLILNGFLLGYRGEQTNLVIPDSVTVICGRPFHESNSFASVHIPDSVNVIGTQAFYRCQSLTSITLPDSVIEIGVHAFYECCSLESVYIPDSVKEIKDSAFSGCISLQSIKIPDSVTVIGRNIFCGCRSLETVKIPDSVTTTGQSIFTDCSALRCVHIPDSALNCLRENQSSFASLEDISLNIYDVLEIEQRFSIWKKTLFAWDTLSSEKKNSLIAFITKNKVLREQLFFSRAVPAIADYLQNSEQLTLDDLDFCLNHTIREKQTESTAFFLDYRNKQYSKTQVEAHMERNELVAMCLVYPTLTELQKKWNSSQKDGVLVISGYKGSEDRESIPHHLQDGTPIKVVKLENTRFQSLHIAADLEAGSCVIHDTSLQTVTFGESLGVLPTFEGCSALESVIIPDSVTEIGDNAFCDCQSLETVVIPDSVTKIGNVAFAGCRSLPSVHIPDSVREIGVAAFNGCDKLETTDDFLVMGGVLVEYRGRQSKPVIPDFVTKIDACAFTKCTSLESLAIPDTVTEIRRYAFSGCRALESVTISNSVTEIGDDAFEYCQNLSIHGKKGSVTESYCQKANIPFQAIN